MAHKTTAFLAALAANVFGPRGTKVDLTDLLPFPPQRRYMTIAEAEQTMVRLSSRYGGIVN